MSDHPSRPTLAALLGGLLALSLACGSPGAARLDLGNPLSPPAEPSGELRIGLGGEPDSLDPNLFSSGASIDVGSALFSRLVRIDNQGRLVPDVATEVPTLTNGGISKDGRRLTFSLRPDVVWSDGQPVVAEDFVYGVSRTLDPRLASIQASRYFSIRGAGAYATALGTRDQPIQLDSANLTRLAEAVGVAAPSPTTLVVELDWPSPVPLWLFPVPARQDIITEHGARWTEVENLVGNGPFILSERVPGDHLTLVPNPRYHGERARVAKLIFLTMDPALAWKAYGAGKLDLTEVPPGSRAAVLSDPTVSGQVIRQSRFGTTSLVFNLRQPPYDNVKVRQALAKAVDRSELVKALEGVGVPTTSWLPPGIPGHNPELGKQFQGYDPAAARRLLAEAGYPDGRGFPALSLLFSTSAATATFLARELKMNLGIEAAPQPLESPTYTRRQTSGDFQAILAAPAVIVPDAEPLFRRWESNYSQNYGGYSNVAYDRIVASALELADGAKRETAWLDAHKILLEDPPAIFLYHVEQLWLRQAHVQGLAPAFGIGTPAVGEYARMWLDKK